MTLADWRRRVAQLYVEVRHLAADDPQAAHAHWRTVRERLYREHPQSPLPASKRAQFGAQHFPYDPALRFDLAVLADERAAVRDDTTTLPVSAGGTMAFRRLGWLDVPFPAGVRRLALYWLEGYAGGLFLPFRDTTGGHETYPSGRYVLDGAKSADLGSGRSDGHLVVDFNFAYQPSCAFAPSWACPLAPSENWLDLPVRAGERIA